MNPTKKPDTPESGGTRTALVLLVLLLAWLGYLLGNFAGDSPWEAAAAKNQADRYGAVRAGSDRITSGGVPSPVERGGDVLAKLFDDDYKGFHEVAVGRFAEQLRSEWPEVADRIDRRQLKPVGRGENWVRVEAPCAAADPWEPPGKVRFRIVKHEGAWMVEHMKLMPAPPDKR